LKRTALRRTPTGYPIRHKPQLPTYATNPRTLDVVSKLVSISCASSKIEELQVQQRTTTQLLRPQLHIILRSEPGSFKSTILHAVGKTWNVTPYSNVTSPAMIGTIDQSNGRLIPGLVWQTRNKPLLLDEFKTSERGDQAAVDVLLGTMETGYYKRKIGLPSAYSYEKDGALFYRVENGEIEVQTRFSAIIATMKNWDMERSGKYAALTQRCIPIRYSLDNATIDAVLDGEATYRHYEYSPPRTVLLPDREFTRIRSLANEVRSRNEQLRSVYVRAIDDLCRIRAVTGKFDPELSRIACNLKAGLHLEQALQPLREL
jgi:hypothetical protein